MPSKNYQQSYSNIPPGGNPRQTEAWALTEAARRMKEAQKDPANKDAILGAMRLNWRLWTIFQAELSSPQCPLPVEIRQNVLSLCNFVDKMAVDILADPKPEKLNVLIAINRELAAGLFAIPPGAATQPPGEPNPAAPGQPINSKA